jgi:uncharacterized protein YkwD
MKPFSFFLRLFFFIVMAGLYSFTPGDTDTLLVNDVFKETNEFRKSNGLKLLTMTDALNAIAQKHSENMASGKTSFGHDGFDKRNVLAMKTLPDMRGFAENVALDAKSARAVLELWKNSSGHRRNLLGNYRYIGIGIARDKQGRIFYTQVFAG